VGLVLTHLYPATGAALRWGQWCYWCWWGWYGVISAIGGLGDGGGQVGQISRSSCLIETTRLEREREKNKEEKREERGLKWIRFAMPSPGPLQHPYVCMDQGREV